MPKTLLLADDSVTIQKVVGISFASEDVTLIAVDNGIDAIARAREERPDAILADEPTSDLDVDSAAAVAALIVGVRPGRAASRSIPCVPNSINR